MSYPMTRHCFGVGRKQLNFHSSIPYGRVADMAEGSPGTIQSSRVLMHLLGKAMHILACASANCATAATFTSLHRLPLILSSFSRRCQGFPVSFGAPSEKSFNGQWQV